MMLSRLEQNTVWGLALESFQPQQKKAQVQSWLAKVPVPSKNLKFGSKWVENRPFGPKQRPNESYGLSGPIQTTPEAKNGQKSLEPTLGKATSTFQA